MSSTSQFVTATSIGTFTGATGAVRAVSNTLRRAFNIDKPYIPLLVSLAVAYGLVITSHTHNGLDYVLALLNGCLLFLSSAGLQQTASADFKGDRGTQLQGRRRVTWLTPWLRTRNEGAT